MHTAAEPAVKLTRDDFEKLERLASLAGDTPVTRYLERELDRAEVVTQPLGGVVRLGSRVRFRLGEDDATEVVLVMPNEANVDSARVSVLTPVGAALIGLAEGSSIAYATPGGRERELKIVKVEAPRA